MPNEPPSVKKKPPASPEFGILAAFLSYLVPGLGQILQGRITKGLLFFVSIYTLFFYGMYLGSGSITLDTKGQSTHYVVMGNVYLPDTADKNNTWGLPTWAANVYNRPQFLGQVWVGIAAWPAIYHYCVSPGKEDKDNGKEKTETVWSDLRKLEQTPSEEELNAIHTSGGKLIELGWVYTVIAGVLNIMVIYDAFAGPAFPAKKEETVHAKEVA